MEQQTEQKEFHIEDAFVELASIVEKLEAPEVTLEESIKLYRQGVQLLAECGGSLDQIEKEMIVLTEEGEITNGENE